jgi:hypothetical protein
MAVVEVDDGVKEATGGSEQHGVGSAAGWGAGSMGGMLEEFDSQRVSLCGLDVGGKRSERARSGPSLGAV